MRKYWIILSLVVVVGFGGLIIIIFNTPSRTNKKSSLMLVYFNTEKIKEAFVSDIASAPAIFSIFPCNKQNTICDSIPWADMFLCRSFAKSDSLSGDTGIILLDVHTRKSLSNIKDPTIYEADITPTKRFKRCKVLIPVQELDKLKGFRYKYSSVTLVTDD